jgi:hypothetical protein
VHECIPRRRPSTGTASYGFRRQAGGGAGDADDRLTCPGGCQDLIRGREPRSAT